MGHFIQCIIGSKSSITELSLRWIHIKQLDLNVEFSLIPLTNELVEDMNELADKGESLAYKEFEFLSKSVEEVLKENSFNGSIGYIETNYKEGEGSQVAIGYSKGNIIEGPLMTKTSWDEKELKFKIQPEGKGAINTVLYKLGLEERLDIDGFDNLGLGNYRSNEKILKIYKIV